jgi:hypothetical protein
MNRSVPKAVVPQHLIRGRWSSFLRTLKTGLVHARLPECQTATVANYQVGRGTSCDNPKTRRGRSPDGIAEGCRVGKNNSD